jgi:hypothetical protein
MLTHKWIVLVLLFLGSTTWAEEYELIASRAKGGFFIQTDLDPKSLIGKKLKFKITKYEPLRGKIHFKVTAE